MTKLTKVKTVGAVIDGHPIGSEIEIPEAHAKQLASVGYVDIITQDKAEVKAKAESATKKESAPKKPATKTKAKPAESKK